MNRNLFAAAAASLALLLNPGAGSAQHQNQEKDITLHVNPRWDQCSIQLDPSLTQGAWHQFTQEAGLVAYFRPLTDARPMGAGRFEVSLLRWATAIDDAESAWNDTFVHPNATHWLMEGDRLPFPGLTARMGVTDRMDVGAYFTKNPDANYGFYGGQLQYSVLNDESTGWAVAGRLGFVSLFGPDDVDLSVYGLDVLGSRTFPVTGWLSLSPYAGVSSYLSRSHEKSAAVDLADENVGGTQAMVGAVAEVSKARFGVEVSTARVSTVSFKAGVVF